VRGCCHCYLGDLFLYIVSVFSWLNKNNFEKVLRFHTIALKSVSLFPMVIVSDIDSDLSKVNLLFSTGPMRGGFSRYIGPGPGEPRKGPWISEGPHSLNHWRFILIFFIIFGVFSIQILTVCPRSPKQYCPALQNFSWRPWFSICCWIV